MDIVALVMDKVQALPDLIIKFAPGALLAIIIFMLGRWIVRRLSRATIKATSKVPNIDETLARFFGSIVLTIGMFAVIIAALTAMNVNLGFLATVAASMMIALGFALQSSLGDVASGIMIAMFRPYGVDEEVEINGQKGVVKEIGLFATRMVTRDNIEVVVSNGDALGNTIKNYYAFGQRRLDLDYGVSYDADLGEAIKAIISACEGDKRIHAEPAPWAKVTELGDSAVNIQLRLWCDADDYRKIKMDMHERVKHALDAASIEIPYEHNMIIPQRIPANV